MLIYQVVCGSLVINCPSHGAAVLTCAALGGSAYVRGLVAR